MAQAYTSTVVAPAQIAFGVVSGAVVAGILITLRSGMWPAAIVATGV